MRRRRSRKSNCASCTSRSSNRRNRALRATAAPNRHEFSEGDCPDSGHSIVSAVVGPGIPFDTEDHGAALAALREHLGELQLPQIAHGRRAIILFEGPQGAGKKAALKQLAAAFDPCHFSVHPTEHDRREASEGQWLARFWRELPGAGHTVIFFRSWYRRVLDDRILGRIED